MRPVEAVHGSFPGKNKRTQWEEKRDSLRVKFDRQVKLGFHGTEVTSNAGLLAYRELDDKLGLTQMAEKVLTDVRTQLDPALMS